jgi:hypothetical protein
LENTSKIILLPPLFKLQIVSEWVHENNYKIHWQQAVHHLAYPSHTSLKIPFHNLDVNQSQKAMNSLKKFDLWETCTTSDTNILSVQITYHKHLN